MRLKVGLVVVILLAACGSPPPQETTPAPAAQQEGIPDRPAPEPEVAEEPPRPAGPRPTLAIVGTPAAVGQHVAISITNRGSSAAELGASLAIEVERDGTFVATEQASALTLRYDCAHDAPACLTLAPGAELLPPEWLGTWGDMQCICTRCGPVEPGTYRFVVTTCDGAHRVEGTPFTIRR